MNGYFITGTNTDAGKTIFTAALLRHLRAKGTDTIAAKPIQTGVRVNPDGTQTAPDMEIYRQASGFSPAPDDMPLCFQYGFEPACSPHLAAAICGQSIETAGIADKLRTLAARHKTLLVEGAGGLLVPLNQRENLLDLVRLLDLPVIIVANNVLGVINHTLLTIRCLRGEGLTVAGVVINHTSPDSLRDSYLREDNISAISNFGKVDILAILPYVNRFDPAAAHHWTIFDNALEKFPC